MDKDVPGLMTPFDELVTTPELQIIKLLIPYAPASGRQTLAGLVKFMELREAPPSLPRTERRSAGSDDPGERIAFPYRYIK